MPVRNGARSLQALLVSLERQTLDPGRFEVIVVDNGSEDATPSIAQARGARVVEEPVPNRSRARNRGAEVAHGRVYAFTDADCVAASGWLEALLRCHAESMLVAGEVRLATTEEPNAIERFERLWRFGQASWVSQGWAATANLLVSARVFQSIGGFDAAYRHIGEDADFCLRAGRAGFGLVYCAGAVVHHQGERRLRPFLERFFRHGYGSSQVFYRQGAGYRAWRNLKPVLGDGALREFGHSPESFERTEWRRMVRLARLGYAARIAGSIWAELDRAR